MRDRRAGSLTPDRFHQMCAGALPTGAKTDESKRNLFFWGAFSRQSQKKAGNAQMMRAYDHMKNDQGKMEGAGLPGPFGEIPRRLKEYYDSLQDEAIPEKFLDLLEKLDKAERAAMGADVVKEPK